MPTLESNRSSRGRWFRLNFLFLAGLVWLISGNAQAVITVGLAVENPVDANGIISVVNGGRVTVSYAVTEDTDNDLNKKDRIELVRVADDTVVSSVQRGKKKSGTVKLRVKNSEGEQLYVQYVRKNSGTQIVRDSHPDDGGVPLVSIANASTNELITGLNALQVRPVMEHAAGFAVETSTSTCSYVLTSVAYGYFNGTECDAMASIPLPHGAVMTSLSCGVFDNSINAGQFIDVQLRRLAFANGASTMVFATNASDDSGFQKITDDSPSSASAATVDLVNYTYVLWADWGSGPTAASNVRLYGCTVFFEGWPEG